MEGGGLCTCSGEQKQSHQPAVRTGGGLGWQGAGRSGQARRAGAGAGTAWQWRRGAGSTRGRTQREPRQQPRLVPLPSPRLSPVSSCLTTSASPHILLLCPFPLLSPHPHRCLCPLLLCPPHACGLAPQTALSSSRPPLPLNSPRPPHLPGSLAPPRGLFPPSVAPTATVFMPLHPGRHCCPTPCANLLTSSDSADLRVDHINSMTATKTAMMRPQISTTKMPPMFSMPRPGGRGRAGG